MRASVTAQRQSRFDQLGRADCQPTLANLPM
jgi:hypothetical protein